MANDYYQLYNHAYSFSSSKVNSGGVTFSLPQNDYGIYGQHVDAFFNTISRSAGATGSLAVWFVSDKGLTYYTHSLGATAAITGYVQSRFPVTSSTTGRGLIDLRGSPDWTKIVGDGIVGPTRGSTGSVSGSNSTQYVNGIKAVFGVLKNQYPNIEWAIAGLPHLPLVMAYAPPVGQSPVWDSSLTNSGGYSAPAWWDPEHPTGSSAADFYNWQNVPNTLKQFYEKIVTDGIQEMVFDNCNVDWLCPDIRIPYADSLPFYEYGYDSEANYKRNKRLCELSSLKARSLLKKSYPLLSTMYPSRPLSRYDDPQTSYTGAYAGVTANSADGYYPSITYRYEMLQAAIDGTADGFVFFDPAPSVVELACTSDISVGGTGYDAQIRARNMFSTMMYGGTYEDGYAPSGSGYADPCVKSELLRYTSKRTVGYLDDIRESVNLAGYGNGDQGNGSGWSRGTKDPQAADVTTEDIGSQNTLSSDAVYGQQNWVQRLAGGSNCNCPTNCEDPTNPYRTQGGALGCCCIEVYRIRTTNPFCCDSIQVRANPINSPQCIEYADCPCSQSFEIDVTPLFPPCDADCSPSVGIDGACNCLIITSNPNYGCDSQPPCLGCACILNGPEELVTPCTQAEFTTEGDKIDYSMILDIRNYARSAPNASRFILTRATGEKISNWQAIYDYTIKSNRYDAFLKSGETTLNPSVSVPALRTQSNKEVLRHLPNQYFTT